MTEHILLRAALAMSAAALPFVGEAADCDEVARNAAAALIAPEEGARVEDVVADLLRHRVATLGLRCGDVELCARVMGLAWRRAIAPTIQPLEIES